MDQFRDMSELEEFESKGFVQNSNKRNLLRRLRAQHGDNFRIFKCGIQGYGYSKSSKYGGRKIFGRSKKSLYMYIKQKVIKCITEK